MSNYSSLNIKDVHVGLKLPPLDIEITTGLIVGTALATRDFEPVHHDRDKAQATGLPDIFMNILTSQGLMSRFVTDWSGPEAIVRSLELKLGAPNVPGMVMTISGEVTAKADETGMIDVAVEGDNKTWGMHMRGKVQLELPR